MGYFDIFAFIVGVVVGILIAIILRARERVFALGRASVARATATRRYVTRSADARYRQDLGRDCQTMHLAGKLMPLTEIIVEPRFLPAPDLPDPSAADQAGSVLHVVPQHHDLPFGYAPFNLETIGLDDLTNGGRRLAILSISGAGKTTALAAIGLCALGELQFETLEELAEAVGAAQAEEEGEEAAEKAKLRRQGTEEQAIEQLRQLQLVEDTDEEAQAGLERTDWHTYTPMLIHLADIDLNPEVVGARVDPAEPLVRAIRRRVDPVTERTIPRFVYRRVAAGQAMLLIDGYDELPPELRREKLAWLRHFVEIYPDNLIFAAGPAEGYGPLLDLGFTPVFLRPWTDQDSQTLAEKWATVWPSAASTQRKPAPAPDPRTVRRAATGNRGYTPLDITLKVWAAYSGDEREVGRLGWYDAYVQRHLDADLPDQARRAVETVAGHILQGAGCGISRKDLQAILARQLAGPHEKPVLNIDNFIRNLSGEFRLMVEWAGGMLAFRHPMLCSYLAAEELARDEGCEAADYVEAPAWHDSLRFVAARASVDRAVVTRLSAQPDLLYSNLFDVAAWLPDAPATARWRGEVFKRLAQALMASTQFPAVRERALSVLIASRDQNILFIFRQALRATDPRIRRLACLGLGALGNPEAIKDLTPMLADDEQDVQLAAGLALGAIGTERAMEIMVRGLLEGEENLRRAVAEALAALPGQGHDIIREATEQEDMMTRRAAVFGLRRIKATWALVLLYRMMLEDGEWYVRSAAQGAFAEARDPQADGLRGYPPTESLGWLISWAAERGEGVPVGEAANQVLVRALQQGKPGIRQAAADTLGKIGYLPALKPLYLALRDKEPAVRDTVVCALESLQVRLGASLPGVC